MSSFGTVRWSIEVAAALPPGEKTAIGEPSPLRLARSRTEPGGGLR